MASLREIAERYGSLTDAEAECLALLAEDWQIIADLSFADLVMWRPVDDGFVAIAQCRPSTGPTVHQDDVVGTFAADGRVGHLRRAFDTGELVASREPRWDETYAVREDALPVVLEGKPIAVLTREVSQAVSRSSSRLELNYKGAADDVLHMITRGEFPVPTSVTGPRRGAPRVGDGVLRLDAAGHVTYASPNALSCFHRLGLTGPLINKSLPREVSAILLDKGQMDETLAMVVMGRAAWRTDIESNGAALSLRAIPVTEHGVRHGAVLLCRDVSELRRRERELITKDATIREIHHRVKNNLQTVAALLRLQSRRVEAPEAKEALAEAMRRVSTIALVHETLSGTLDELVNFDDLARRSMRMSAEVASPGVQVSIVREGDFGMIPAQWASSLALVITELVTNAVEHGFVGKERGEITVQAERSATGDRLKVSILDDGVGLQGSPSGLGSSIVRTLVENELDGAIDWTARQPGPGSVVTLDVRVGEGRSEGRY
ncbi:sensor histidine kinase [Demequina zhanjiangensis]|uniref:histidine kinase n=1 Tax=Demequina zhanjiangensis TaxID=3051659 RepID=A0ABT8FXM7_9MICO|nr:PAS domain-containing sensor histidine kinase [Demequina sp. SYSU T00b26]MDN4471660.1 histidine kinase N-terminal domain-containing protein [Demequina sp. SYSU T00b26]